jgi:ketosteroid isomerase-like protein
MGDNLEIVREALEAFLRGDAERALALADPDIVSLRAPPIPDPQTYHGTDGVLQMWADWTTDFDEFEMEPLEYVELGDRVIVDVIQRAIGRASGAPVDGRFWFVFTVASGRLTRMDAFLTKEQALEAASPPA